MFDGENRALPAELSTGTYPAVWLQLQVRRLDYLPGFAAAIPSVINHAKTFPGMVRFGFHVDWERARFRTFGAFDTAASLQAYVTDGAHGAVYRRLRGRLGEACVRYGTVAITQLPASWDDIPESYFAKTAVSQGK